MSSSRRPFKRRVQLVATALVFAVGSGCHTGSEANSEPETTAENSDADGSTPDPAWVRIFNPQSTFNGYTLTLHERHTPVLLDMNGRAVHRWPEVKFKSRVRLLDDGGVLGISRGRGVAEYDWHGKLQWQFEMAEAFAHHDVIRLTNGNTLVVLKVLEEPGDTLVEVNRQGDIVWSWKAVEHLADLLPKDPVQPNDLTHINSVQELPPNPWSEQGDRRFEPGNILVSARNLDTIFIIDRPTRPTDGRQDGSSNEVVWTYTGDLDQQHEALMNRAEMAFPGRIQVLNNRRRSFRGDRQSEILEIDPRSQTVEWKFRAQGFYTATAGVQQALPNGNILVTSTRGRRVFEINREQEIVWQWVPPLQPARSVRVAADATPQLRSKTRQRLEAVTPPTNYLHVDPEAYRFARRGSRRTVTVNGQRKQVLQQEADCRTLFLPESPTVTVEFGVDQTRFESSGSTGAEFQMTLRGLSSNPGGDLPGHNPQSEIFLLTESLPGSSAEGRSWWLERTLYLARYEHQLVELCLKIRGTPGESVPLKRRWAYWQQPAISSPQDAVADLSDPLEGLTDEELRVRKEHLQTMGYVD